jgi:hypothetical protein
MRQIALFLFFNGLAAGKRWERPAGCHAEQQDDAFLSTCLLVRQEFLGKLREAMRISSTACKVGGLANAEMAGQMRVLARAPQIRSAAS